MASKEETFIEYIENMDNRSEFQDELLTKLKNYTHSFKLAFGEDMLSKIYSVIENEIERTYIAGFSDGYKPNLNPKWHYVSEGDIPSPLRKHQADDHKYLVAMLGNHLKIVTGTTIATDMADGQFIYAWCSLPKLPEVK